MLGLRTARLRLVLLASGIGLLRVMLVARLAVVFWPLLCSCIRSGALCFV